MSIFERPSRAKIRKSAPRYAVVVDIWRSRAGVRRRQLIGTYETKEEAVAAERRALQARAGGDRKVAVFDSCFVKKGKHSHIKRVLSEAVECGDISPEQLRNLQVDTGPKVSNHKYSASLSSEPERLAYSYNEAVALTSLSRSTLKILVGEGKLRSVKIGRRVLIPRAELERLIREGA